MSLMWDVSMPADVVLNSIFHCYDIAMLYAGIYILILKNNWRLIKLPAWHHVICHQYSGHGIYALFLYFVILIYVYVICLYLFAIYSSFLLCLYVFINCKVQYPWVRATIFIYNTQSHLLLDPNIILLYSDHITRGLGWYLSTLVFTPPWSTYFTWLMYNVW